MEDNNKKGKVIVITIISVVLLVIVILGVLYFTSKKNEENKIIDNNSNNILQLKDSVNITNNVTKEVKKEKPDFKKITTSNETADGLYAIADDYGTSYYYRGAVDDNWVKFAGFYWRIIRINGDGSVRMIYQSKEAPKEEEKVLYNYNEGIQRSVFNLKRKDNADIGYMYGKYDATTYEETHANINDSEIKKVVDSWYKTNIVDAGYSDKIVDVVYCNDRSVVSGSGFGKSKTENTIYGSQKRVADKNHLTLKCPQKNDAFTVNDTSKGNGALTYPVGLITADEVSIAGGTIYNDDNNSYLSSGKYWTMSPYKYTNLLAAPADGSEISFIALYGMFRSKSVDEEGCVNPVISLDYNYFKSFKGNGTYNNPFAE